jgi:phage-related protein
VQDIGRALKDFLGRAIETIVPLLKQLGEFLVDAFQRSLPFIKQFGTFLVDSFNAALPFILKFIGFVQELAGVFVRDVLPVIIQVGGTIVRSLVSAFNKVVPAVAALIPMIGDFIGAVKGLFSAITSSPVFEYIIGVLKILAGVFVSTIIPLLVRVGGIFVNTFVNIVGTAIRTALGIVRGILNIIIGVIKVFTGLLTGNWSKAWEGVKQILKGAVGFIGTILRGLLSTAGAIIKGLGNVLVAGVKAIPGLLKGAGQLFLNAGKFLIDAFVEGIKNAAGLIEGIATNVWNFVRGLLNGAIGKINSALEFTISLPLGKSVGINPPDIPALASGGVVNSATLALIGEGSESEAVLPLSKLREMLDEVYKAGADKLLMLDMASGPRDLVAAPSGGGMRVVSGELRIDPSGRAFIRGIAEEVVDEESNFTARRGRVGAR